MNPMPYILLYIKGTLEIPLQNAQNDQNCLDRAEIKDLTVRHS